MPQANTNAEGADDGIWNEIVVKIVQVGVVVVKCYWRYMTSLMLCEKYKIVYA